MLLVLSCRASALLLAAVQCKLTGARQYRRARRASLAVTHGSPPLNKVCYTCYDNYSAYAGNRLLVTGSARGLVKVAPPVADPAGCNKTYLRYPFMLQLTDGEASGCPPCKAQHAGVMASALSRWSPSFLINVNNI